LDMMSVPSKITLDASNNQRHSTTGLSPIKEINLDNVRRLDLHGVNARQEAVLLKTPPRVIKVEDDHFTFDKNSNNPNNKNHSHNSSNRDRPRSLTDEASNRSLNTSPNSFDSEELGLGLGQGHRADLTSNSKVTRFSRQIANQASIDATNEFLSELLAEDESNANYRKQLFKLTRRIIRLEKENQRQIERSQSLTYIALGASIVALGLAISTKMSSSYY